MKKSKTKVVTSVSLDKENRDWLRREQIREGRSVSNLVNVIVSLHRMKMETTLDKTSAQEV